MPINALNVGKDVTLQIVGPFGNYVFSNIKTFDKKQMTNQLKSHGIDGIPKFAEQPAGWDGTISLDRVNSNVDDAFASLEQAYYNGQDIGTMTITETITETSGITQYRYTGVSLRLEEGGSFKGDGLVDQKIGFVASRRTKVL